MLDKAAWEKFFGQIIELWVGPEIQKRKARGVLADSFDLWAAQVVFPPEETQAIAVRLNEEVRAKFHFAMRDKSTSFDKGEIFSVNEIEKVEYAELFDDEVDSGHITIFRYQDKWFVGFDCLYNKQKALRHAEVATQFIGSAETALEGERWNAFVDHAYSAAEILAKSRLMLMAAEKINTHKAIQSKYSRFVEIGNAPIEFKNTLNRLAGLRHDARYSGELFALSQEEAVKLLNCVRGMKEDLELQTKRPVG